MSKEWMPVMYFMIWLANSELWRLFPNNVAVWLICTCVIKPKLMDKSTGYWFIIPQRNPPSNATSRNHIKNIKNVSASAFPTSKATVVMRS